MKNKIIGYLCRLTCDSWITNLRTYVSDLGWAQGFELCFPVVLVLGEPVGYLLGYSINMFFGLVLSNSSGTLEGSLVGF